MKKIDTNVIDDLLVQEAQRLGDDLVRVNPARLCRAIAKECERRADAAGGRPPPPTSLFF